MGVGIRRGAKHESGGGLRSPPCLNTTTTFQPPYIPLPHTHTANGRAEEEKAAAIRAYHADPQSIAAIYVGNEDLIPAGPFSVDDIVGHIQGNKKGVLGVGLSFDSVGSYCTIPTHQLNPNPFQSD